MTVAEAIATIRAQHPHLVTQDNRESSTKPVSLLTIADWRGTEELCVVLHWATELFPLWLDFLGLTADDVTDSVVYASPETRNVLGAESSDGSTPSLIAQAGTSRCTYHRTVGTWNGLRVHVSDYRYDFIPDVADVQAA